MDDSAFFSILIAEQYEKEHFTLHPLRPMTWYGEHVYGIFRVDQADGTSMTFRAYHRDFVGTKVFGLFSRYPSLLEWLQTRAATLAYLEQQGYPAPRVMPTKSGAWIGESQEWYTFMTTFIEGEAKDTSPEKMRLIGAALGRLHTLPLPPSHALKESVGLSWWEPTSAIPYALDILDSPPTTIPSQWHDLLAACRETLRFVQQQSGTAQTITHADCWAENAVQTPGKQVILIDWECAGLGAAILDLGGLFLHCHFDQIDNPTGPMYQPDPARIAAVVNGYTQWRYPHANELNMLLEAVRFSIAWRGAWFTLNARDGWNEGVERRMTRWQKWYAISEEITNIALDSFE